MSIIDELITKANKKTIILVDVQDILDDLSEVEYQTTIEKLSDMGYTLVDSIGINIEDKTITQFGLKQYLTEIGKYPLLTAEQELEIAKSGDTESLIQSNLRLVVYIAKKYIGRRLDFEDLIQYGNIGLINGVNKYDYKVGTRVSTYVTWWIRQAITKALIDYGKTIRTPIHIANRINKLNRAIRALTSELDREPSVDELVNATEFDKKTIEKLLSYEQSVLSYDQPCNSESDTAMLEMLKSDENLENEVGANDFLELLNGLTNRERLVIKLRYGIGDNNQHSLEEVGARCGVTKQMVRQIERRALRKINMSSLAKKYIA